VTAGTESFANTQSRPEGGHGTTNIGTGISRVEACRLMRATGRELTALLEEAGRIRTARTGRVITYSRKVFHESLSRPLRVLHLRACSGRRPRPHHAPRGGAGCGPRGPRGGVQGGSLQPGR
jgi:hypothetical protein